MSVDRLQPEIIVFAGPNGSGKSTVTKLAKTAGIYINADDIKRANHCSDLEAAQRAEMMRENALEQMQDFTFETVLSTDRNLRLLQRARELEVHKVHLRKSAFIRTQIFSGSALAELCGIALM